MATARSDAEDTTFSSNEKEFTGHREPSKKNASDMLRAILLPNQENDDAPAGHVPCHGSKLLTDKFQPHRRISRMV
jgi:hypothetical protein